jgi:uncharacterized protein YqhQ
MADLAFGGQALIEGVMMRGPTRIATAVRMPDGQIKVDARDYRSFVDRHPSLKKPVLRGAISFFEMMAIGMRALNYSAEVASGDGSGEESNMSTWALLLTMAIGLGAGVLLFVYLPLQIAHFLGLAENAIWFNLVAGGIRVTFLITYMSLMLLSNDLRRVFEYHGAEHKSIWALEVGADLTPAGAQAQSRLHPRCGTSFLLIVTILAVFLYAISDSIVQRMMGAPPGILLRFATHFSLLPIVAGVSFELLKFSGKHRDERWVQVMIAPGLWLQRITTREPDESQLEVALAALAEVIDEPMKQRAAAA